MDLDHGAFALHLSLERTRLDLSVGTIFHFDPSEHPRDLLGRFKDAVAKLGDGESLTLQDRSKVVRKDRTTAGGLHVADYYHIVPGGEQKPGPSNWAGSSSSPKVDDPDQMDQSQGKVARSVLDSSARRADAESLGGAESHKGLVSAQKKVLEAQATPEHGF